MPADTSPLGSVDRAAMIARWKPVHLGHAAVLRGLVRTARHTVIGIGSSNRYDLRNPFTATESAEMIRLVLDDDADRVELIEVPDLGDGPRWREMVCGMLGQLDLFVTANEWVHSLMIDRYRVIHPVRLVPPDERVAIDGTMVRRAMARDEPWEELVPPVVAAYLVERGLVDRFRREFGLQTLARDEPTG